MSFESPQESAPTLPSEVDRRRLIYRWDLDKTYLRTEFDTFRQLLRLAMESAHEKRAIPGATSLLREIREADPAGLFIISGSPEQMRKVLEAKLRLDGIRWDGFVLKPQLKNLLRGRFRFLKEQLGYKLAALLDSRSKLPADVQEVLFGDDAEADAFIYSIYADVCAGRVGREVLGEVLRRAGVYDDELPSLLRFATRIPRHDGCRRIFIHLDRVSSPAVFDDFGPRVCPFYNYFQPALVLLSMGALDARAALRVGAELVIHHAFTADALVASYLDLVARKQLGGDAARALIEEVGRIEDTLFATTAPTLRLFARELEDKTRGMGPRPELKQPPIDYINLFSRDKARARRARDRARGKWG